VENAGVLQHSNYVPSNGTAKMSPMEKKTMAVSGRKLQGWRLIELVDVGNITPCGFRFTT